MTANEVRYPDGRHARGPAPECVLRLGQFSDYCLDSRAGHTGGSDAAAPSPAAASVIEGRVVGVSDGNTVTALYAGRRQHKIRLLGIDAPEKDQDFGERSKQSLSALVFGKDVRVEYEKKDRYGRTLGKVVGGGCSANLEQVRAGLAWFYRHYADDAPEADRAALDGAEREARQAKRGCGHSRDRLRPGTSGGGPGPTAAKGKRVRQAGGRQVRHRGAAGI